ncbi:putative aminopeptidase W07G4.4 [Echinococcus granulosus]|nr:putative aminopeptidase W07G4.4 [Echinococcus granulosus]
MEREFPLLNAILGALHALYNPLELREAFPEKARKFDNLLVFGASKRILRVAYAMEEGRRVTRDIAGSDPERMSAPRIVEYLKREFASTPEVIMQVREIDTSAYPLIAAVNRAASGVERHNGKVVHLSYKGGSPVDTTLFLIGKGITHDTGGTDVKAGGVMAGMHRDKSGAAAVAGFFRTLSLLKPKGLSVHGAMALVRNSIGCDGYVADEIITSRAGRRVRVGNTDAEGRMVMTDLLCEAKEQVIQMFAPLIHQQLFV